MRDCKERVSQFERDRERGLLQDLGAKLYQEVSKEGNEYTCNCEGYELTVRAMQPRA